MHHYDEHAFSTRIDAALRRIRTVLDNTRNPQYAADVPHRYDDKYLLAELVTRVSIASIVQCLEAIGLTGEQLGRLQAWAKTRSVTLRLDAREDCRFLREETRKVESPDERVVETRGIFGTSSRSEKVVTTVTEYFWSFEVQYELVAFQGTATGDTVRLIARKANIEIKTTQEVMPRRETVVRTPLDVNLTWLLGHLDDESRAAFAIDRAQADCHTPRRNDDVDAALAGLDELSTWCASVHHYLTGELFPVQQEHGRDLAAIHAGEVFVPVLPLFEEEPREGEGEGVVPAAYVHAFLAEEVRSLAEKRRALAAAFPRDASLITIVEAELLVVLLHARDVCRQHADSVDYIENMLRQQLVAAIGKELTPADFTAYMEFHHRKLVKPEFRPLPFSYAIRRPEHYPEGVLTIEAGRGSASDAITTTVRRSEAQRPMSFGLDASTRVRFLGERYLHAWIGHQFSGQPGPALGLVARARQFSSFILMVGRIASADSFEPRIAIILQNKDLLKIPLLLEQIPTPQEFRDAIESLSPEQQRFAKAFRGMQLESTLFAVCIVQIKPQLEKLLKLPPDSLTKEIRMTEDLLDLFIQYQIPSDLLSYDGPAEAPIDAKLARVKDYIARMHEMIERSKVREIEEEREREALRLAQQNRTPPPQMYAAPPSMPGSFGGPPPMPAPSAPSAPSGGAPRSVAKTSVAKTMVGSAGGPPPMPSMSAGPPPPVAAPPPPQQAPSTTPRPQASSSSTSVAAITGDGDATDYTRIPADLDRKFEALDIDGALRATIINPGDPWARTRQVGLLSSPATVAVSAADQRTEKHRAFDLLDALSRSGALPIDDASLHVVLAATHCFDKTLLETVIQDNVNPIEKVERSLMIVGTTIHARPAAELLADDQRERFLATSPQLGDGSPPERRPER